MAASATPPDRQSVIDYALGLGFHLAGIASVPESPSDPEARAVAHLQTWLKQGHQADMAWMANPKRQDIRQVLPGARSRPLQSTLKHNWGLKYPSILPPPRAQALRPYG